MGEFSHFNNFASESNGGKILFATDDFFAPAEMLLKDEEPLWLPTEYTEYGKWMDGWETRRKRISGHDWCIIKLGAPCIIKGILADTAHFTGNYVPRISVQAASLGETDDLCIQKRKSRMGTACTEMDLLQVQKLCSENWTDIIPRTVMQPGNESTRKQYIQVNCTKAFTHIRLNYYPDGGLARFKVYGIVKIDPITIADNLIDLVSLLNGGICLKFSNAHFGQPGNLIKYLKGTSMADGWETARRLDRPDVLEVNENGVLMNVPGKEWAVFQLGVPGVVDHLLIDTSFFKGNFADNVQVHGIYCSKTPDENSDWCVILPKFKLSGHNEHFISKNQLKFVGPFTHVKVTMAPDGGISRVRIFGYAK